MSEKETDDRKLTVKAQRLRDISYKLSCLVVRAGKSATGLEEATEHDIDLTALSAEGFNSFANEIRDLMEDLDGIIEGKP